MDNEGDTYYDPDNKEIRMRLHGLLSEVTPNLPCMNFDELSSVNYLVNIFGCNGIMAILFKHVYVLNNYYFDIN